MALSDMYAADGVTGYTAGHCWPTQGMLQAAECTPCTRTRHRALLSVAAAHLMDGPQGADRQADSRHTEGVVAAAVNAA